MKLALIALACAPPVLNAQSLPIDTARSTVTVHVGKTGLLSAATGHEHWINAPIASGSVTPTGDLGVEFKVESAKMTVKADPKVDEKTQAAIQKDMQEMTLESGKYPEIAFRSTRVESAGAGEWKVQGSLSLHGETKPVTVLVRRTGDAYSGYAGLKQTDFGIKPISAGGGMIKIKNEIDIEFQVYTK